MKSKRNFIKENLIIKSKEDIIPYLENLKERKIKSVEDLKRWWADRSETNAFLEEDAAWRYIKMSCNTADKELAESFNFFVKEIEPVVSEYSDVLDKKLINSEFFSELDKNKYEVAKKKIKRSIELFRKENIDLFSELQQKEREFGTISGAMTVNYKDEEMTLQKAGNFLKDTDREVRKEIFEMIHERRFKDNEKLDTLLSELIQLRHKVAENAGFDNYRDYMHSALKRFDYTIDDCISFHNSIKSKVLPIINKINGERKSKLGYDILKPYDTSVDIDLKPALKPFEDGNELIDKAIYVFAKVRPKYGEYLKIMKENSYLDLNSRKGKSPGGYNYPLYESNIPFIFMNATGNQRDLETMMHEGGHAIHSFLSSDLELVDFKELPSEVAELASMSMELISSEYWDVFYSENEDLKRAKRNHLEGVLSVLPWIATVDKFQHQLYLNPDHNAEDRKEIWNSIAKEFGSSVVDWSGYEKYYSTLWQRQMHIFEVPFYYIEYGIAQLGAIAVWRNFKNNPQKALNDYENALKLGYSVPIPEIYKTAGIEFNFSKEYISELMDFVKTELNKLK
ncbi:MAG: M3 family oligoendopeptidase [Bacteroidales bacterium]|nr:M3 family oligoendopeptidase [Bacteroidales bacterium]